MQFKKQYIVSILTVLLTMSSCSDEFAGQRTSDVGWQINLSGQIVQENVTRASDYGFVNGDRMGIYIVDYENGQPGTLSANDNRASNVLFTYSGEDGYKWTSPAAIYWRDQQTPVDVYGYYPGHNYIAQPTAWQFEVESNQGTEAKDGDLSGYEQSDLLWGKVANVSPTTEQIVVKYNHIFAGVRVHLNKGTGLSDTEWEKLEKIVLVENTIRHATVNLSTGSVAVNTSESATPIRMLSQSGDDYRAVVIPQKVTTGKQLLSITLGGQTYSHSLTKVMNYQGGKLHNFTITVNKREDSGDYEIKVTDEGITPWTNDEASHQFSAMMYVTVNCPEIGKLKESITAAGYDYKTIQNLKVTGELTGADFEFLRSDEMPELRHLNLKDALMRHNIVYDGWWDYGDHDHDIYDDDILPGGALSYCNNLRSLVLPSTLKALGDESLREMRGLQYSTLEIPEGVTKIGNGALSYNEEYNGVELILPATLDTICINAFYACGYRCELKLSDNIRYIGGGAFDRTPNFYGTFHVPSKLSSVEGSFNGLGSNGSFTGDIIIPQGVTRIDNSFGVALKNRVSVTIPRGVKYIGGGWPGRFLDFHFNDDLEELGHEAFYCCNFPNGIELPSQLKIIGTRAFWNCGIEGELVIPESCLSIGDGAFSVNGITKITLPSKLESIGARAFNANSRLQQITIPKYVEYIGDYCFSGDEGLQTIICLNPEPPKLGNSVFGPGDGYSFWMESGVYFDKCVLEVPEQSIELYRHADGWKDFQNITAYHELAFNIPEVICLDKGTTRTGILRADGEWEVSECPSWVAVSPKSGTYKEELAIIVSPNSGETREGRIVFSLKGKNYTTYTSIRQVASDEYKEDATVTLQTASAGGNAIPLFIVGEGYGAEDIASGKYKEDMEEQMEYLFSIEPYKTYREYFTVSTAYACSPQSGMVGLTKFSSNNDNVWNYAKTYGNSVDERAAILVLCNTKAYGNHTDLWDNGLSFSWLGKTEDAYPYDQRGEVLHHFGGRGFGKLGPEYVNHFTFMKACGCPGCNMTNEYNWARERGWWQNVSTTGKMTELPWYHLIFHDKYAQYVDVYEGALNHARSTYRSENQSVMGAAHIYFYNTISREEIVRRIMEAAGETYTFDKFVAKDKVEFPQE